MRQGRRGWGGRITSPNRDGDQHRPYVVQSLVIPFDHNTLKVEDI